MRESIRRNDERTDLGSNAARDVHATGTQSVNGQVAHSSTVCADVEIHSLLTQMVLHIHAKPRGLVQHAAKNSSQRLTANLAGS